MLLKRTKIDNFVGGLIIGAIFSLAVNLLTVQTQEIISKQRTLEAIEREITFHALTVSSLVNEERRIATSSGVIQLNVDGVMAKRFSTKIWDNPEVYKYLLEVDPNSSAKIDVYYSVMVNEMNRLLEENYQYYQELYKPCRPFYTLITSKNNQSKEYCNMIAYNSIQLQADIATNLLNTTTDVKNSFHPTKDRLNNIFLRVLLGNQTVNILR